MYKKAPNKWQFTIRASNGSILQQGFNGTVGWHPSGQLGVEQVAIMGRLLGLQSCVNLPRLLSKMKLVGTSRAGTNEAFVIEAPIIEGNLEKLYFDSKRVLRVSKSESLILLAEMSVGCVLFPERPRVPSEVEGENSLVFAGYSCNLSYPRGIDFCQSSLRPSFSGGYPFKINEL